MGRHVPVLGSLWNDFSWALLFLRYKLFLSDSIDDEFLNIADGAGHGEDHCEFLGAEADDRLEVSPETWVSPSAFGKISIQT